MDPTIQLARTRLEKYSQRLESGVLTIEEVVGATLDELAEVPDMTELWLNAPDLLRREVSAYLTRVGPNNVPPAWVIGVNDPEWRAAQTSRRKQIASKLLN